MVYLKNRYWGFELSGVEYKLIFEKENMGFVRFANKSKDIFYLDPSPFLSTVKPEIYVLENCPVPPAGKLIEAVVRETEDKYNLNKTVAEKTLVKYVIDWKIADPNKLRTNLTIKDDFLNYVSAPIPRSIYNFEDLQNCLALSIISSPQLTEIEKGGINSVVLGESNMRGQRAAITKIMSIVPNEFKKPTSRQYYKLLEDDSRPKPVNCNEVNLTYLNITNVPVHIPLPFEMKFNSVASYKENLENYLPLARAFMIDALLFQPEIPEVMQKKMENTIYDLISNIVSNNSISHTPDIGSIIPKLTTSYARLDFKLNSTSNDLNEGKELWESLMGETETNSSNSRKLDTSKLLELNYDEEMLYMDIINLKDIGIDLTFENIKAKTSIMEWKFEDTLEKLKIKGRIYYLSNDKIGLINFK